jgi:hypothetical protein
MLAKDLQRALNQEVLKQAKGLNYRVSDKAPSTENELWSQPGLVVWSGASEGTIYGEASINWAFRAVHDALHLRTGLNFSPEQEIEMGRIQAAAIGSDIIAKLFYIEIAGQAAHYLKTGQFVVDQIQFTLNELNK